MEQQVNQDLCHNGTSVSGATAVTSAAPPTPEQWVKQSMARFRRKCVLVAIVKALLIGLAVGTATTGALWALVKKSLLPDSIDLPLAIFVGVGAAILGAIIASLLLLIPLRTLARRLDRDLGLDERVQTMRAFRYQESPMLKLQREDTAQKLRAHSTRRLKVKRMWIYLVACFLGIAVLVGGIMTPDVRGYVEPEPVVYFRLTQQQRDALRALIVYVEGSDMTSPAKEETAIELRTLLTRLDVDEITQDQMTAHVSAAVSAILSIVDESHSYDEVAAALRKTGESALNGLIKALKTVERPSSTEVEWSELYLDNWKDFRLSLRRENDEAEDFDAVAGLEAMQTKLTQTADAIASVLNNGEVDETDALIMALNYLLYADVEATAEADAVYGLRVLSDHLLGQSYIWGQTKLDGLSDKAGMLIYAALNVQKANYDVGEYVVNMLCRLFGVERPVTEEEPEDDSSSSAEGDDSDRNDDDDVQGDGGIGEGVVFGSDDIIYHPATDTYVAYGEVIDDFYALVQQQLTEGKITEEERAFIEQYFQILQSGLNKDK